MFITTFRVAYSQNFKFGKVTLEELNEQTCSIDASANAAYLYKYRKTYTEIANGNIGLITTVYVRLKIYNEDGFKWATVSEGIYGSKERVSNIKAVTYNIENGKIVKTKLEKDNIFTEKKSENWKAKKFTMPNLKKGTVVEWTYKIYSPFFTEIDDMVVQHQIPVKKYEATVRLLGYFTFNKRQKGYYPFKIQQSTKRNIDFDINDNVITIKENNVPAIIKEPYVNNLNNYTAALQLEVASLKAIELGLFEDYATSWEEIAKDIFKNPSFGGELKKTGHLKEAISTLKSKFTTPNEKIQGALAFVKSSIKWNDTYSKYTQKGLKKAYKEGVGNIADINLTLIAVLKELGLNVDPVLVSTRNHGVPLYPTKKGFNYVIAQVKTADGTFLLDATEKYSLPNILPLRVMNWQGVAVKKEGSVNFVNLMTTAISKEDFNLSYKISEDGLVEGLMRKRHENHAALRYRSKNSNTTEDDLISEIEEDNDNIEILNFRLSNLKEITKPIIEMYKFEKEDGVENIGDKMYIKPLLFSATKTNPFKIDAREYPIDFGTPWEEKISTVIQIPEGYKVETLPENLALEMTDGLGKFIYSVKNIDTKIQIISLVKINQSIISSNYYQEMKELFKRIVEKQQEKIVLSKI